MNDDDRADTKSGVERPNLYIPDVEIGSAEDLFQRIVREVNVRTEFRFRNYPGKDKEERMSRERTRALNSLAHFLASAFYINRSKRRKRQQAKEAANADNQSNI